MLELTVAAARHDKESAVIIEQTQNLANFHHGIMRRPVEASKSAA